MRIKNRFVVTHPIHGVLLDWVRGVMVTPTLTIPEPVWSSMPRGYGSALTFPDRDQALKRAGGMADGLEVHPVTADFQIDGLLFASLRECVLAGLEPWYVGDEFYVALSQDAACRQRMERGIADRTIGFVPAWQWTEQGGQFRRPERMRSPCIAGNTAHN